MLLVRPCVRLSHTTEVRCPQTFTAAAYAAHRGTKTLQNHKSLREWGVKPEQRKTKDAHWVLNQGVR